jgi:hypothetical protein
MFVGSIIWSMIFETLIPLAERGETLDMWLHILAFPLAFLGLGVLIWGAVLFLRDTFSAMENDELQANLMDIQAKRANMDQRVRNALLLLRAWRRGTLVMLLGFGILALAGFTANAARILGL